LVPLGTGFVSLVVGGCSRGGGTAALRGVESCQKLALPDALQVQVTVVILAVVMVMVRGGGQKLKHKSENDD
jgi:hypothetical protein